MTTTPPPVPPTTDWATGNVWRQACQLPAVISGMQASIKANPAAWCKHYESKYVNIRIDTRDGNFIITDNKGERIDDERLRKYFPNVKI